MQHPFDAHIVHEGPFAQSLFDALVSQRRPADAVDVVVSDEFRIAAHPKLFAEKGMPPGFRFVDVLAVVPGFPRGLNGVDDSSVAGATADMTGEGLRDGFAIIRAALLEQQRRAHQDAGNAEAALHAALDGKRFTQHAAHLFVGALEGDDLVAFHLFRLAQARQHGPPVDFHHAAAAAALRSATVLGRNDTAVLAQHFEEVHPRFVGTGDRFTVESEIDLGQLLTSHAERRVRVPAAALTHTFQSTAFPRLLLGTRLAREGAGIESSSGPRGSLLQHAIRDRLELFLGQQTLLFEGLGLDQLYHGHALFVAGLEAELLAPLFDGRWAAVFAENDGDRLLSDQGRCERDVFERMLAARQAHPGS